MYKVTVAIFNFCCFWASDYSTMDKRCFFSIIRLAIFKFTSPWGIFSFCLSIFVMLDDINNDVFGASLSVIFNGNHDRPCSLCQCDSTSIADLPFDLLATLATASVAHHPQLPGGSCGWWAGRVIYHRSMTDGANRRLLRKDQPWRLFEKAFRTLLGSSMADTGVADCWERTYTGAPKTQSGQCRSDNTWKPSEDKTIIMIPVV